MTSGKIETLDGQRNTENHPVGAVRYLPQTAMALAVKTKINISGAAFQLVFELLR